MHIAIVEDNLTLLENLRLMLQGETGCAVTGAWQSAEEALAAPVWEETDILLADLDLPGMSGVDLISQLKSRNPGLNCMAYTIYEDRSTVFSAIKAGACGYLLKGSTPRELIEALRDLHEGGAPMSPKIARKVIHHFQEITGASLPGGGLTSREQDVLRRLEQGQSYKEIGVAIGISAHTVHTHIKHIYEKLQGRTRAEVMRKARQRGWL
ncbi:MAG: response regulator [Chthoniobacteraceae bacterium]